MPFYHQLVLVVLRIRKESENVQKQMIKEQKVCNHRLSCLANTWGLAGSWGTATDWELPADYPPAPLPFKDKDKDKKSKTKKDHIAREGTLGQN